jgi:hypothetical protein
VIAPGRFWEGRTTYRHGDGYVEEERDANLRHPAPLRLEDTGDLEAAAMRSKQVGDEQMADQVRWIRS